MTSIFPPTILTLLGGRSPETARPQDSGFRGEGVRSRYAEESAHVRRRDPPAQGTPPWRVPGGMSGGGRDFTCVSYAIDLAVRCSSRLARRWCGPVSWGPGLKPTVRMMTDACLSARRHPTAPAQRHTAPHSFRRRFRLISLSLGASLSAFCLVRRRSARRRQATAERSSRETRWHWVVSSPSRLDT